MEQNEQDLSTGRPFNYRTKHTESRRVSKRTACEPELHTILGERGTIVTARHFIDTAAEHA
eukprot:1447656-Alexandrium_andersonii.AAC.1